MVAFAALTLLVAVRNKYIYIYYVKAYACTFIYVWFESIESWHQTCIIWFLSCSHLKYLEPRKSVPEHVKCFHWWMMRLQDTRTKALLAMLLLSRNGVVLDPFRPCVGKCATTIPTRWCRWLPSCNEPTRPGSPSKGALILDHIVSEQMIRWWLPQRKDVSCMFLLFKVSICQLLCTL